MKAPTKSTQEQPFWIRLLLACGAIGPLLFIVSFLVEGATRPHYSALHHVVSSLSQGEDGWIQITNFIVCGALVFGFAIGLRHALRTGRGSTWGPILLGIFGLGLIGAGIFVTDPLLGYPPGASSTPSIHGILHNLMSLFVFVSLIAACFVLARRDIANPGRQGWALYSIATGILVAIFFVLTDIVALQDGPAGLIQRICIILGWCWISLLAIRLMNKRISIA
ncbi:DUF998 domain-containing protein [Ktedonospora formicarum]|uniref:DUF998 domain-containing protein n=1 Tax=Ktedonospora formicarum TaxID=2778364 RepID=A0A8J3MUG8_9CHLR|nr:DUF998 domain-containing protein [Ktedonospora formicarum]GHO46901.1 hypothetical protein KSX_50640 [Ktedonospora formicarum]